MRRGGIVCRSRSAQEPYRMRSTRLYVPEIPSQKKRAEPLVVRSCAPITSQSVSTANHRISKFCGSVILGGFGLPCHVRFTVSHAQSMLLNPARTYFRNFVSGTFPCENSTPLPSDCHASSQTLSDALYLPSEFPI